MADGLGLESILASAQGQAAGLGNVLLGWINMRKAKQKREELGPSPEFQVPESYDKYIGLLQGMQRQQMPGYGLMKSGIEETTAASLTGVSQLAESGPAALAGLGMAMQNRQSSLRQLGVMAAQHQYGAQQAYAGAVAGRAPWEEQQFITNQYVPWQQQMNEIMGMRNVGTQMYVGGWDQFMGAGIQGANLQAQNQWSNRMMPQQQAYTPQYNPQFVSGGMTNPARPTYTPPGGTYNTMGY